MSDLLNNFLLRSLGFWLVGCVLLSACTAGTSSLNIEDPGVHQVWPQAPAQPRIQLLRSLKSVADLADKQAPKSRLLRWLTGEMAEQAPLVSPYGIATDGQGRLWVSDPGLHAVHALDLNKRTSRLSVMAGDERFSYPTGICYDASRQRVYVADSRLKRILVFSSQGKFLQEIKGISPFGRPAGLAIDPKGDLLVADVLAGKIRRFTPSGKELAALGSPTTPDGRFNRPIGVTVDANGLIYVIDSLNFRIEVLSAEGKSVASIGKLGDSPGSLSRPRGIAVDRLGHIFVADAAFDNIQIFNIKGQLLLFFGGGGKYGLSMPANLSIDSSDRIYAVDSFNHRIQIYQILGSED